jgi:hypothetical protein
MSEETWILTYDVGIGKLGIAVPRGRRGVGEPDFTRAAPDRHRECMVRKRCQICRRPGTWVALSSHTLRTIEVDGKKMMTLHEPWLCHPCGSFAIRTCPSLIRRRREDDLILCRPTDYQIGWSSGWMEGPLEEESKAKMPAMWGELHLHEARDEHGRRVTPVLAS